VSRSHNAVGYSLFLAGYYVIRLGALQVLSIEVTNGGLAIENTFNRFAELFGRQPGCNSLEIN